MIGRGFFVPKTFIGSLPLFVLNFVPNNPYWNRVKILLDLLSNTDPKEKGFLCYEDINNDERKRKSRHYNFADELNQQSDYFVWIDADLAIIDWDLNLNSLL